MDSTTTTMEPPVQSSSASSHADAPDDTNTNVAPHINGAVLEAKHVSAARRRVVQAQERCAVILQAFTMWSEMLERPEATLTPYDHDFLRSIRGVEQQYNLMYGGVICEQECSRATEWVLSKYRAHKRSAVAAEAVMAVQGAVAKAAPSASKTSDGTPSLARLSSDTRNGDPSNPSNVKMKKTTQPRSNEGVTGHRKRARVSTASVVMSPSFATVASVG